MALLEVSNLGIAFGGLQAVAQLDLSIEKGHLYGLIGPNGAGKTTVFNMLTGVYKPTEGNIILDGKDITGKNPELISKAGVARTFQNIRLFNEMSVLDNVKVGLHNQIQYGMWTGILRLPAYKEKEHEMNREAKKLLKIFGLEDKADLKASQLPYGEQRKLEIARALATNPQVLLCDEATSALDPATTDSILSLIKDINRDLGITAVIITHEMSVIEKICSHVAIIHRGKIVEHGEVEEVFFHPRTEAARRLVMPEALQNLPQENLYRLIFNGRSSFEPVIANMVLECHCPVNIMYADTRDIGGIAFGQMVLQLPECPESRRSILEFAKSRNILLEEMKHV